MSLKNKNYLIIRQAFATELMDFCNVSFKIKRNAMHVLKNRNRVTIYFKNHRCCIYTFSKFTKI